MASRFKLKERYHGSPLVAAESLARELAVVTVLYNNRAYAVLNMELGRVGASGQRAKEMFDLSEPALDFVALANGMGVPATRASTADDFVAQLDRALATEGPSLIEAVIPPL